MRFFVFLFLGISELACAQKLISEDIYWRTFQKKDGTCFRVSKTDGYKAKCNCPKPEVINAEGFKNLFQYLDRDISKVYFNCGARDIPVYSLGKWKYWFNGNNVSSITIAPIERVRFNVDSLLNNLESFGLPVKDSTNIWLDCISNEVVKVYLDYYSDRSYKIVFNSAQKYLSQIGVGVSIDKFEPQMQSLKEALKKKCTCEKK